MLLQVSDLAGRELCSITVPCNDYPLHTPLSALLPILEEARIQYEETYASSDHTATEDMAVSGEDGDEESSDSGSMTLEPHLLAGPDRVSLPLDTKLAFCHAYADSLGIVSLALSYEAPAIEAEEETQEGLSFPTLHPSVSAPFPHEFDVHAGAVVVGGAAVTALSMDR
ncbi:hypothetical protein KIPB_009673, partial [Kipferlia bialata]|eukprot:g9673.t1